MNNLTKTDILMGLFANNEAFCAATSLAREHARTAYESAQAPLLRARLVGNHHQIRITNAELAAEKTAAQLARTIQVSSDIFARSNLEPGLNGEGSTLYPEGDAYYHDLLDEG